VAPTIVAALLVGQFIFLSVNLAALDKEDRAKHKSDLSREEERARSLQEKFDRDEERADRAHRDRLTLAASGSITNLRAGEWARRQAHAPEFAVSPLEKSLLELEKLGRDKSVTDRDALERVAQRVTPAGSAIKIEQSASGFVVRVAYKLSAMTHGEAGAMTKHTSHGAMRSEVEEVTARVVNQLFDYCGTRGIARIIVSCNHAVIKGDDNVVMDRIYRATITAEKAARVTDWRRLALSRGLALMDVEDTISFITINSVRDTGDQIDPATPLVF